MNHYFKRIYADASFVIVKSLYLIASGRNPIFACQVLLCSKAMVPSHTRGKVIHISEDCLKPLTEEEVLLEIL